MASTPQPQSYEQILGDMLRAYQAKTGVNDRNTGGVMLSFYETVALSIARASGDVFQLLRDLSVDRAAGDALRNIATDEGLQDLPARVSSGTVTVTDTSFSKISSKVYAGANPPNVGSNSLLVSDASLFPSSGSIYIGRGSSNVEGPIAYSAKTQIGGYWQLTLSSPTTKFHNINESVILAQGGVRNIPAGTVVRAPASGASPDINFTVTRPAVILDGEISVSGVPVSAQEPGTVGNVPIGGIKEFSSAPFSGASVKNELPFKTGRDVETDDQLRIRIKRARLSKGLGTSLAVKNSVIGATPSDENSTISSSEIITGADGLTTLYIDDGTGYEAKTEGVGIEVLVDSALGGENYFQLKTGGRQTSVAKAFLISNLKAPFDVAGTDKLAISVGGTVTEHTFSDSDFVSPGGATAYEIVASINSDTSLNFSAATSNGGTQVVFFGKTESKEAIQAKEVTSGRDVATLIGLPSNQVETLRLFKNKIPLSKDGYDATVSSARQADWSASITTGDTLILSADGTAAITYSFTDADFIEEGTYTTVSSSNSLESWINVLNSKLTGVTAAIVGERITITSNLLESNRAAVSIDASSTLVSKGMFSTSEGLSATGKSADYTVSRNTAQIKLKTPLSAGDSLVAGTQDTEARIESSRILGGTVTLSGDGYLWILTDDSSAKIISTGVVANTVLSVSKPSSSIVRYTSTSASAFANVAVGDYVIVWTNELSSANRIEGRVYAKTATTLDIKITLGEYSAIVVEGPLVFQDGFVVIRTTKVPQKLKVAAGTKTLSEIADELNLQATNCEFSVFDDEILVVNTLTKTTTGSMLIVSEDSNAKALSLPVGSSSSSNESLYGFYESDYREGGFPLFVHSDFSSEASANPPDSYISTIATSIDPSAEGLDPNFIVGYLQPYGSILDLVSPSENTSLDSYSGSTITIEQDNLVRRLRTSDRWYAANPLDFGPEEEMVVVLDGDASNKTFTIPLYRRALTNTSFGVNSNSFNAYDADAGATAPFTTYFNTSYKFDDFKILMQAKNVLDPSGSLNAILFRSVQWGRSGEKINVGYAYPTSPNSDVSSVSAVDKDLKILISLKSGSSIPTTIDGTTEWDVTITPNNPASGTDQVTYTWTGTGSAPGLGGLAGGEYVNIISGSQLSSANLGVFRVSTQAGFAPSATSFTVVRKNGEAVAESDKATLVSGVFSFFAASNTTAQDIVTYVTASLSNFMTAVVVDDGGLAGTGVISKSTYEDSGFSYKTKYLMDGLNWVGSTSLGSSPQFTLKKPLSLPSAVGYAFNNGEPLRFVPTNIAQLSEFLNVLAVTGYTTLGKIQVSRRDSRLELSTKVLGGSGSVQIVGGQANASSTPILGSSSTYDNTYTLTSINKSGIDGLHSDQWVKLSATNKQNKDVLFKSSLNVRVEQDTPTAGQSTITLSNRTLTDRHFGKPRHHVRTRGRTFKVERQGDLTCFSWDGSGTSPFLQKTVALDDSSGGTVNVQRITGTSECNYIILSGLVNFTEVSIGDLVTVSGMAKAANNGTFLVTGISNNGRTLRVLNGSGVNEFSTSVYQITDNANVAGDDFIIGGNTLTAGIDFVVGGTAQLTAANLASAISALPGVSATASGISVTVLADNAEASISTAYVNNIGAAGATVSTSSLVGTSFSAGNFSCTTEVAENDTIIVGSPFNILNQGKYRIVRRYKNSFYVENENSVEELVSIPYNSVSLGFDSTTQFDVDASSNAIVLTWNGSGTEPALGNAQPGDEITFGNDFSANNQGTFMVIDAQAKAKQITKLTMPQGSLIGSSQYFYLSSALDATLYYVWYKVDGVGSDPAIGGRTGILVNIASTDTSSQVASVTAAAIDALTDFVSSSSGAYVRITNAAYGPCTLASNINVNGGLVIESVQLGQNTFLKAINAKAVSESSINITNILECHRPPFSIYEYEASIPDDTFIVSTSILGSGNQASWKILKVLSQDRIVISGTMSNLDPTNVAGDEGNLIVQERTPFVGYKHIRMVLVDPANTLQRGIVVFDSRYQANRLNEAAAVQIDAVGKLGFSEVLRKGLDSYRYHSGLIGEANRIVYGEPRDTTTYPGVAAAGAEIFIREPLVRRVSVGVAVRIETGIPFAQIVEQIRTNVTALINGNDIGQAIAISNIISTINSIPGVKAIAVTSPLYNASNDTINIGPSEKAKIIDPVNDVSVSQIS